MGSFLKGSISYQVNSNSAATNTLTGTSLQIQYFTGTTQTLKLPPTIFTAANDASVGQFWELYNAGSGNITVQYQDGTSFTPAPTILPNTALIVKLVSASTANGTWAWEASTSSDNNSFTLGSTSIALGSTTTTVSGLTLSGGTFTGTSTFPGTSSVDGSGNATYGGRVISTYSTGSSNGGIAVIPTTTTDLAVFESVNSGNTSYFGNESSTAGGLFSGTIAYATLIASVSAKPIQFFTDSVLAGTIDTSQNFTGIGRFISNYNNAGGNGAFTASPTTGTDSALFQAVNTSNTSYFGNESSTAGGTFTGSTAYATVVANTAAKPIQFFTNGTLASTIDSSQNTQLVGGVLSIAATATTGVTIKPNNTGQALGSTNGSTVTFTGLLPSSGNCTGILIIANSTNGATACYLVIGNGSVLNTILDPTSSYSPNTTATAGKINAEQSGSDLLITNQTGVAAHMYATFIRAY